MDNIYPGSASDAIIVNVVVDADVDADADIVLFYFCDARITVKIKKKCK